MPELPEARNCSVGGAAPRDRSAGPAGRWSGERRLLAGARATPEALSCLRQIQSAGRATRQTFCCYAPRSGTAIFHLGTTGRSGAFLPGRHAAGEALITSIWSWSVGNAVCDLNHSRRFVVVDHRMPPAQHSASGRLGYPEAVRTPHSPASISTRFHGARRDAGGRAPSSCTTTSRWVSNIYANESPYAAGIDPRRPAGQVTGWVTSDCGRRSGDPGRSDPAGRHQCCGISSVEKEPGCFNKVCASTTAIGALHRLRRIHPVVGSGNGQPI